MKKKSIEQQYQKLDDISHVLLRPGMYIGSTSVHKESCYIFKDEKMEKTKLEYNPGFLKLFDEIISNSVDESKRSNSLLDTIKVEINRKNGQIVIWDNGGIPVEIHPTYKVYVPELIFGNLRAGSNFDDEEDRVVVGTNGVGAALVSIFSKKFKIETCDGKKKYTQIWSDNMRKKGKPSITESTIKHTKITFMPDYEKLETDFNDDNYNKLVRKVYDVAGCNPKLKVYLNKQRIKINSFKDYIKLYTDTFIYDENDEWKVAIAKSEDEFSHISFVNGVETSDPNSSNVSYIADQIVEKLKVYFKTKHKTTVRPSDIKSHLFLFIDSTIINPKYSSQTKEKLITEPKNFKTEFEVNDRIINKIIKSDIVENILRLIEAKELAKEKAKLKNLNKKKKVRVTNYFPATKRNKYLVLCEGHSATGGLQNILSRDEFGFFSLRGKPLNTLEVPINKITTNKEIESIVSILDLDLSKDNNTIDFEGVLLATDMDLDGISIVGLLLSFFYRFTPELIKRGKIKRLKTPLLAFIKDNNIQEYFFTLDEYNNRLKALKGVLPKGYKVEYYKGLGSLEGEAMIELFKKEGLDTFIETLEWDDDITVILENWLSKKTSDFRKDHLREKQFNINTI